MALRNLDTVEIIRVPVVADGGGGFTADPDLPEEVIYCGRGKVEQLKPARTLEAAQVKLTSAIRVTLFKFCLPVLSEDMQLRWRGKRYLFSTPFLPVDQSEREFRATAAEIVAQEAEPQQEGW